MIVIRNLAAPQIAVAQERLLKRFLDDPAFTAAMSRHPAHARLGEWLPAQRNARVLELGCGPGKYVAMLHTLGYRVVGVDLLRFASWGELRERTSAVLLDHVRAEELPFREASFDHVVCLGALLYFQDVKRALQEIRRVVKPGGCVIVRTVNKDNLYTLRTGKPIDPESRHLYSMAELVNLLAESGLRVAGGFSYGFWPPIWPHVWWYLTCTWLSQRLQDALSAVLSSDHRVNHVVLAWAPA